MADILAPERPAWCFEEGEEQVGGEEEGKGKGSKGRRKGKMRMEMQNEVGWRAWLWRGVAMGCLWLSSDRTPSSWRG